MGLKTGKWILGGGLFFLFFPLFSQQPDFSLDSLSVVEGKESLTGPDDIWANLKVYCDGNHLSLVIEIRDNSVETHPGNYYTDHVELFFSLPQAAYPKTFEHRLHPTYIYAAPMASRGEEPEEELHRFFSTYAEYSSSLTLKDFLYQWDYPDAKMIKEDSLQVPLPAQLKQARLDYGLVHLGLFPDGRPPVLYNTEHYTLLEKVLGINMGDLRSGIIYTVDPTEYGYLINVQISPEALGFVLLPYMEEVNLAVDVIDTDFDLKKGVTVLSSTPLPNPIRPYNRIQLQNPLKTNFSPIPDRVFEKAGFRPTLTYSDQGWVSTAVEVDALALKAQVVSERLTEVRFLQRPLRFRQELDASRLLSVEELAISLDFVNELSRELVFTLVNNHLHQAQHVQGSASPLATKGFTEVFFFPDGTPGLLQVDNASLNPFGWGACGLCLDERISIHRIERDGSRQILTIEQGEGEPAFCQIGNEHHDGFQVTQINWVRKGEMLVLQLSSRTGNTKKRVRISWDEHGNEVRVDNLP